MLTVMGIDPGGRFCGLVVRIVTRVGRDNSELAAARVLDRRRFPDAAAWPGWCDVVSLAVLDLLNAHAPPEGRASALATGSLVVGLENVRPPNPHQRRRDGNSLTNVAGIIDTALLVGHLRSSWPELHLVEPGGNGSLPEYAYPPALRPRGERLGGPSEHARSAWDVAGAAVWERAVTRGAST